MLFVAGLSALSPSARTLAIDASAHAAGLVLARQRLAAGGDGLEDSTRRLLEKVAFYRGEPAEFAKADQVGLSACRGLTQPNSTVSATTAWRRGDLAYEANNWPEATWYWRTACVLSAQNSVVEDTLLSQTSDQALTVNQRAMALFHLGEYQATAQHDLVLSEISTRQQRVFQLAPDDEEAAARLSLEANEAGE